VSAALEVISPGIHTTMQDARRIGFQDIGVPASGPLDRISLRLANALVGNPPGTPALELLLAGPTLRVLAESARIALVGGGANIEIRASDAPNFSGAKIVPAGRSVRVVRDEVLRITSLGEWRCACLAIEGGLAITPVLGSASTYVRGALGGLHGRALRAHDNLPLNLNAATERDEAALSQPLLPGFEQVIRVVPGPQADYFTHAAMQTLLSAEYSLSAQSDRMGYRLDGPLLTHARGYNVVSDGIVTGSIQVPGSGQPIILMVDNQTTGGYPKIATVISADIPLLGRRKPGRKIRFAAVDVAEAEALRRQQEADIERQCTLIITTVHD